MPRTLPTLTMAPPSSWRAMTSWRPARSRRAPAIEPHDGLDEAGRGLGRQHLGRAPGVVHQHVEAAVALDRGVDHPPGLGRLADVGRDEDRAVDLGLVAPAGDHVRPGVDEGGDDAGAHPAEPPVTTTTCSAKSKRRPRHGATLRHRPPAAGPSGVPLARPAGRWPNLGAWPRGEPHADRRGPGARRDRRGGDRPPAGQRARRGGLVRPGRRPARGRPGARPTGSSILRADGRGFCAGVDIKEINAKGDEALVGVNRGCFAAFAAVYDCEVPVIAAVQGFCLGGGIGLAGNADMVVASEDATFGLPEVDRGALGAATHLARLVPQHAMRKMVYTAKPITAAELAAYGSVAAVVPPDRLRAAALELAGEIATKSPTHHPPGQGVAQRHRPRRRQAQLPLRAGLHLRAARARRGRRAARRLRREARRRHLDVTGAACADKRTTVDDIVGELRSGMTDRDRRLGLAPQAHGRRPRHLPLRPDRPDRRRLRRAPTWACSAPPARCARSCAASSPSTPSRSTRTGGPPASTARSRSWRWTRGCSSSACRRRRGACPFLPTRAGLGSDVLRINPDLRLVRSPYGAGSPYLADPADADVELVAMPALHLDAAIVHTNRADAAGQRADAQPRPLLRPAVPRRGRAPLRHHRAHRRERAPRRRGAPAHHRAHPPHADRRRGRGPRRRPLHRQPPRLRA